MSASYSSERQPSEAKQKVTFYLSPELHRDLKVRAAVETESMSDVAERALSFYLDHPEVVDRACGSTHQVHYCPQCDQPFVLRQGEVKPLGSHTCTVLEDSDAEQLVSSGSKRDELVPC